MIMTFPSEEEFAKNVAEKALDEIEINGHTVRQWILIIAEQDCISRQAALDAFGLSEKTRKYGGDHSGYDTMMLYEIQDILEDLPPVTPAEKVGPCEDCISRELALKKMADYVASGYADSAEDFEEYSKIICQLPSVTPARKIGRWVNNQNGTYTCDNCGCKHSRSRYCPNCGAKMIEDGEE